MTFFSGAGDAEPVGSCSPGLPRSPGLSVILTPSSSHWAPEVEISSPNRLVAAKLTGLCRELMPQRS